MRKQMFWLVFWLIPLTLAIIQFVVNLQSGGSKGRLLLYVMLILLFASNCIEAWRRCKKAISGNQNSMNI
jgi:hypothetical protein